MTFSENQVRQLYVAKALQTTTLSNAGDITVEYDAPKKHLYFKYLGAGGQTRSDLIDISKITSIKATDATAMSWGLKRSKVILDSTVNSGAPVAGQDYLLRIPIFNFVGLSDQDQYFKYGMVHAVAGMTASTFYATLAVSLFKNFSRELQKLVTIYLETSGTSSTLGTLTAVTQSDTVTSLTGTYTGIVIEEAPQDWILGVYEQTPVNFLVQPDSITVNGDSVLWGVVSKLTPATTVPNGRITADLEYFLMGERGDQYRMINFPNVIRTKYLVDSTVKYNYIDINYFYEGHNEGVQKSEKTITLVVPKIGATNSVSNVLANSIITALATATGLTITALDTSAS